MKFKRFASVVMAALLVLAVIPAASIAEGISASTENARMLAKFDTVWAYLDAAEQDALALGANASEVTMAVYKAALLCPAIDEGSVADLDCGGFSFKVSGMAGCYDYKARNVAYTSAIDDTTVKTISEATKEGPTSFGVLLVGPYYGQDSNFTNQYRNEAQSIGDTLGGEVVILSGTAATGPSIANAVVNAGVVIYDSHGGAYNGTSYLCLTTGSGITSTDLSNNWAINGGSWYGIDGRYIENHISGLMPNNIFWMAICEGMMASGHGVTGYALMRAGAGCVYGYSQSVTFTGDYIYEATFWNEMKNGATVAEAFDVMTATHGNWDPAYSSPSGNAWPIVMSPVDDFPTNPDSHQTVYCDWSLFGGNMEPVALESFTLSADNLEIYRSYSSTVRFERNPNNANHYELQWSVADPTIASVTGNNFKADITGLAVGETDVICSVYVDNQLIGTASVHVNVLYYPTVAEAINVPGGNLEFTYPTANYPWQVAILDDGTVCAKSGNGGVNSSTSTMQLVVQMAEGDTLNFRMRVSSESNYDKLGFYVNNTQNGSLISGEGNWINMSYVAATAGTYTFQWRFVKDVSVASYDDCGYVDDVEIVRAISYELGDVTMDGTIDATDALTVLRFTLGLINNLSNDQIALADYDGSGSVNASDALAILRHTLGLA